MLTGAHPFAGKASAQQLIRAQIAEMPPPIQDTGSGVTPHVAQLVMQCLEKDPDRRPRTGRELHDRLSGSADSQER